MEDIILKARRDALDEIIERYDIDTFIRIEHSFDIFIDFLEEYIAHGVPAHKPQSGILDTYGEESLTKEY